MSRSTRVTKEGYCWCSLCQEEYPCDQFYDDRTRNNGKKSVCKKCDNELRHNRRSKKKPAKEWLKMEMEWLQKNAKDYGGQWIAVRGGKLIASSEIRNEVIESTKNVKNLLITYIPL